MAVSAGNNIVTFSATEVSTQIVVVVVTGAFAKLAAVARAAVCGGNCWSVAMIVAMVAAAVVVKITVCFWRINQSTTGAAADTAGNHTSNLHTAAADLGRRISWHISRLEWLQRTPRLKQ